MGASMCVPVCMFVRTSTVLLPSRWCVVMSVTWIASNWGQVGIRSPHGCVRSPNFIAGAGPRTPVRACRLVRSLVRLLSIRKVLDPPELLDDLLRDRQVDDLVEGEVLGDLPEGLLARDGAFDVLLRHALVLRPRLGLDEDVERVPCDLRVELSFLHRDVD